jgi:protein farnesyltransferase subunit beta
MHENGESDMRGTYCALAVAALFNLITPELIEGVPEYVMSCVGFDGGIAGEPMLESHGGYTYCGIAAIALLRNQLGVAYFVERRDVWLRLLNWLVKRQCEVEGGFNGRPNKLVDSCYSFWIGASIVIVSDILNWIGLRNIAGSFVNREKLGTYVIGACQCGKGGLIDKPGKAPDYYHTCYALSGLSVTLAEEEGQGLKRTNAIHNIPPDRILALKHWLHSQEILGESGYF